MNNAEAWEIDITNNPKYNKNNSPCYSDMMADMKKLGNGVFSCTLKMDNGNICDYVVMENSSYARTTAQGNNKIPRR